MSVNLFFGLGNLTRAPELKYTTKGTAILSCGMALNHTYKDGNGNKAEEVTFIDFEAWGRTAEIIGEYCSKGDKLHIQGRLKLDTWEEKQTQAKRSKLKVVVDHVTLIGGKRNQGNQDDAPEPDDIPF